MMCRPGFVVGAVFYVAVLMAAGPAGAQTGRVQGTVVDAEGNRLPGVTVTVTSPSQPTLKITKKTNAKGKFTVAHVDVTARYIYTFEKDGFKPMQVIVRPAAGGTKLMTFTMKPAETVVAVKGEDGSVIRAGSAAAIQVYNEGVKAQEAGDLEAAEGFYRQAAEIDPELAAATTAIAAVRLLQGDAAGAAALTEKALEIDPDDHRALQLRYDAYRALGDEARAREAARALRSTGDATDVARRIFNEGVDAYSEGKTAIAVSRFQQALELDPDLVPAYLALSAMLLDQGVPERSLSLAESALERDPGNTRALRLKLRAALRVADTRAAVSALDGLAASDPGQAVGIALNGAKMLYNAGKVEAAGEVLGKVLELDPNQAGAHYLLGLIEFNRGNTAVAKEHLERSVELAPDSPDAASAREILSYMK